MNKETLLPLGFGIGLAIFLSGCGPNTATPSPAPFAPLAPTLYLPFAYNVLFQEDFNDNDLHSPEPWWYQGIHYMAIDDVLCDGWNCWLRLEGPVNNNPNRFVDTGLTHTLGPEHVGIIPDYISFNFFAYDMPGAAQGFFRLDGKINPSSMESSQSGIDFHVQDQQILINWNTYTVQVDWDSHWFLVEFKNIDWTNSPPRFDLFLDGSLVGGCISFVNPIASFDRVNLFNLDYGYVGFDNIYMAIGTGENAAQPPACAPPPPPPPLPSDTPTPTVTPTATFPPAPVECAGLDQGQCEMYPHCQWVTSSTRGGSDYCTDK